MVSKKYSNLEGKVFGKVKVLSHLKGRKVLIKCKCGNTKEVNKYDLVNGKISSCRKKGCSLLIKDLSGKKFNQLTVLKKSKKPTKLKTRCVIWECRCSCGNTIDVPSNQLTSNRTKSCGCQKGFWVSEKKQIPVNNRLINQLYNEYKQNAKKRNLDFNISKKEFSNFLDKECFYCLSEPRGSKTYFRKTGAEEVKFNGIDRIDNNKGYLTSNCVSCCKYCNRAKNNLKLKEFLNWIKELSKNVDKIEEKL